MQSVGEEEMARDNEQNDFVKISSISTNESHVAEDRQANMKKPSEKLITQTSKGHENRLSLQIKVLDWNQDSGK